MEAPWLGSPAPFLALVLAGPAYLSTVTRVSDTDPVLDLRGIPTHACPACGSRLMKVIASFEDFDIAMWLMNAECAECGSLLTAPCPPDKPDYYLSDLDPVE